MTDIRWITGCVLAALLVGMPATLAQQEPFTYADPPATNNYTPLTPAQLEELVGPIALYPDPLIGIVLPASTFPLQIVQAARYLNANPGVTDPPKGSEWDSSVIALLRYPDVLVMMDQSIEWTGQLGDAMYYQQQEVLDAVQRARAKAQTSGYLESNDKQEIIVEENIIRIEPAQPDVVYVPVYDPQVIFVETAPVAYPVITYSVGYGYGPWLPYTCDWFHGGFFYLNFYFGGHWHTHYSGHHRHWRAHHHRRHHHGHHHGHHGDDEYDGHHGDGHRGEGHHGEGGRGGSQRDVVQGKNPRSGDGGNGGKNPGDVASKKVPKTDPSGYPIKTPAGRGSTAKTPRNLKWDNVSEGKTPSHVGYDRAIQYDRKPNRTTLKIPSENNVYSNRGSQSFKVPQYSQKRIQSKTPRVYNVPRVQSPKPSSSVRSQKVPVRSYGSSSRSFKTPSRSFSSRSFKAPSTRSMKTPSFSRSFSGGKGFRGGGKSFGGGGGKMPKGGR